MPHEKSGRSLLVRNTLICLCSLTLCIVYLCSSRLHASEPLLLMFCLAIRLPLYTVYGPSRYIADEEHPYMKDLIRIYKFSLALSLLLVWPSPLFYVPYCAAQIPFIALHFYGGCVLPWREMKRQS